MIIDNEDFKSIIELAKAEERIKILRSLTNYITPIVVSHIGKLNNGNAPIYTYNEIDDWLATEWEELNK